MNGQALLQLQLIDTELDQLAGRRKRLPEAAALERVQAERAAWQSTRRGLEAQIERARETIAAAETSAAEIDAKRTRLEAQMKTVIVLREAEALMHEIAVLKAQRDALDDTGLEAMEAESVAGAGLEAMEAAGADLDLAGRRARKEFEAAAAVLADEEAALLVRRHAAAEAVDAADLARYQELRTRFGGVAIAQLDGHRCTGCHLDLSPVEIASLKAAPGEEPPECPQCGRLLVL